MKYHLLKTVRHIFNNNTSNICIINNFVNIKSSEINKNKE